jgi:hypothetical protein
VTGSKCLASYCDIDELELLHPRTGHTSHKTLREAVRNLLVTGVVLPRRHFGSKAKQKYRGLCDICGRSKIARCSFPRRPDRLATLRPGSRVSAYVIIMLNTTSLEGYKLVLLLEDNASSMCGRSPLKTEPPRRSQDVSHSRSSGTGYPARTLPF